MNEVSCSNLKISDWLGKAEFEKIVSEPGPHLIVFSAKWCGFCSRFLEQAKSLENPKVEISLIDTDEPDESLWDDFSIRIVPTIIVFKDGKIIFRRDGKSGAGLKMSDRASAVGTIFCYLEVSKKIVRQTYHNNGAGEAYHPPRLVPGKYACSVKRSEGNHVYHGQPAVE